MTSSGSAARSARKHGHGGGAETSPSGPLRDHEKGRTMKKVPKHIKAKIERMSLLMDALVDLNLEVEGWLEANGVEDADYLSDDLRDYRGYGLWDEAKYIERVERAINGLDDD